MTEELLTQLKSLLLTIPSDFALQDAEERSRARLVLYHVRQLSWQVMCEIDRESLRDYLATQSPPPKAAARAQQFTIDDL
jgi:hypothetical protein